ncbi:NAD(P)/FAD-dependent oxidoreductase [Deferrisoma camini]|uniref:NAD(P)/FAD-dependent oxidoreductase n=1 Tax=Deferrisoma camini TaxID=1035120 RepID=UPI00046D6D08|nr:FAD-dependent oxidoreductase [Deferrisoma camini]
MRHVIVGASAAGLAAAEAVCSVDPSAEVTLLTEEPYSPYCRPLISYALAGEVPHTLYDLPFRCADRVRFRTSARVLRVDPEGKQVFLEEGDPLPYDRLLLATGAVPRPLGLAGEEAANVFGFRTRGDAEAIDREIRAGARTTLVLGGGLVGVKAAHALAARSLDVTLCIGSEAPLSRVVNPEAGRRVAEALEDEGVSVRTGYRPSALVGGEDGRVTAVRFDPPGEALPCDLVVRGKGVRPRAELAEALGIGGPAGIPVDGRLRTPAPDIWAAGDVARTFDVAWRAPRLNAIWPAAVEQGIVAGRNMAGGHEAYPGSLAMNSIKVGRLHLVSAGITRPPEGPYAVREIWDPAGGYRRVVLRDGVLVGAVVVGTDGRPGPDRTGLLIAAIRRGARVADLPFDPLVDRISWSGFAFGREAVTGGRRGPAAALPTGDPVGKEVFR